MRLIEGKTYYTKPWYNSYRSMMDRCYREKSGNYKYYGAKGIKVCDEWHDIRNFEKWVENNPYSKGMTIDRIDVNGNYSPDNCRWATMKTQCNNRSNTVYIEHNGEVHTISEWSVITGINRSTLNNRYCRGKRGDELFVEVVNIKGKKRGHFKEVSEYGETLNRCGCFKRGNGNLLFHITVFFAHY